MTGQEWLLRLVFRVGRNTFKQADLVSRLGIRPLNETPGLEVYGSNDRVWVTSHKGPWQSVTVLVHRLSEIDTPAFRKLLNEAAASFRQTLQRLRTKPEDVMPWKVHGERWHLGTKGFPPGKKLLWDHDILPRLLQLVREVEPGLEVRWEVQYFITLRVPAASRWWGQWQTKRAHGLVCRFLGKKGQFNLAQFEGLGAAARLETDHDYGDYLWLVFQHLDPSQASRLKELLREHLRGFREAFGSGGG
jgi:excinuclease ABC subunit A